MNMRPFMTALLLAWLVLVSACSSRPPAGDALPRAARQQLQQGLQLARQQPAAALRHFEAAHHLAPGHPALLLNMGLAHSQLRQHGAAAAWLNAWLATGVASPQRGAIEQQYRRELSAAGALATPLLRASLQHALRQLQESPATAENLVAPLARGMAAGGDIYGSLKLLSESRQLLPGDDVRAGWLPAARDSAWEALALVLVLTRQLPAAERARLNLRPGPRRDHFWDRLATRPAEAYRELPGALQARLDWIIPLAAPLTVPPRELPARRATAYRQPPLSVRTRELAEVMTAMQPELAAALRPDNRLAPAEQGLTGTRFNTLLFLIEASAAERHTARPE